MCLAIKIHSIVLFTSKIYSGAKHDKGDIAIKYFTNWVIGVHFIVQTSYFLLINDPAVA